MKNILETSPVFRESGGDLYHYFKQNSIAVVLFCLDYVPAT